MIAHTAIIRVLNRKHHKTLEAIFAKPMRATIKFADIEKLLVSLGAVKFEGSGSRVAFVMPNDLKMGGPPDAPAKGSKEVSGRGGS